MNFLVPKLYFDDIVAKQRLSEIDLEVELEMARSVRLGTMGMKKVWWIELMVAESDRVNGSLWLSKIQYYHI